jgi:hypothetical protein
LPLGVKVHHHGLKFTPGGEIVLKNWPLTFSKKKSEPRWDIHSLRHPAFSKNAEFQYFLSADPPLSEILMILYNSHQNTEKVVFENKKNRVT